MFVKLEGPEAPDGLSSLALRLLKENCVVYEEEYYLTVNQMSRKSKTFSVERIYWNFRKFHILEK